MKNSTRWICLNAMGIKSLTECLLYARPMAVRAANNYNAFAADTLVMWISLPIYGMLKKQRTRILPDRDAGGKTFRGRSI